MEKRNFDKILDDLLDILPVIHKKLVSVLDIEAGGGISHYHFIILHMLGQSNALAVSEIGQKISVSRPQMTAIIDKLVSLDLVARVADSRDRRIIRISITPAGTKALSGARQRIKTRLRKKLSHLDEGDFEVFSTAIMNIREIGKKIE